MKDAAYIAVRSYMRSELRALAGILPKDDYLLYLAQQFRYEL